MVSSLSQAEVLIALVVAAHAGVLAVRLCFSLYKARWMGVRPLPLAEHIALLSLGVGGNVR